MGRDDVTERDILGHVERWPELPYPHGISALIEYRTSQRFHYVMVTHYVPHTSHDHGLLESTEVAFYARTL